MERYQEAVNGNIAGGRVRKSPEGRGKFGQLIASFAMLDTLYLSASLREFVECWIFLFMAL